MIKTLTAALVALSLTASPALAQTNAAFTGPRVELNLGVRDITNAPDTEDFVYGAAVGYDAPLGDRFTLGAEATATNVFDNEGRTYGVGARLGYAVTPHTLAFARAGYVNYNDAFDRDLDGLQIGGGLNFSLSHNSYATVEYRYSDLEQAVGSHGALVGIGIRF